MSTETSRPRQVLRSVFSVLAGIVAVVVLSVGTDMALQAAGIFPSFDQPQRFTTPLQPLATAYRTVYGIAGSYLAASLAPNRPMGHALAVGGVGSAESGMT